MIRLTVSLLLVQVIVMANSLTAMALSCRIWDELSDPYMVIDVANIFEASVIDVQIVHDKQSKGNSIKFLLHPKEVFRGEASSEVIRHPWYTLAGPSFDEKYINMKGKDIVVVGDMEMNIMCVDGIIELYKLERPELFKSFLRCMDPAIALLSKHMTDNFVKGLPGKLCQGNGTQYKPEIDGMCAPDHVRLTAIEEMAGRFLTPEEKAVRVLCPNPLSKM